MALKSEQHRWLMQALGKVVTGMTDTAAIDAYITEIITPLIEDVKALASRFEPRFPQHSRPDQRSTCTAETLSLNKDLCSAHCGLRIVPLQTGVHGAPVCLLQELGSPRGLRNAVLRVPAAGRTRSS